MEFIEFPGAGKVRKKRLDPNSEKYREKDDDIKRLIAIDLFKEILFEGRLYGEKLHRKLHKKELLAMFLKDLSLRTGINWLNIITNYDDEFKNDYVELNEEAWLWYVLHINIINCPDDSLSFFRKYLSDLELNEFIDYLVTIGEFEWAKMLATVLNTELTNNDIAEKLTNDDIEFLLKNEECIEYREESLLKYKDIIPEKKINETLFKFLSEYIEKGELKVARNIIKALGREFTIVELQDIIKRNKQAIKNLNELDPEFEIESTVRCIKKRQSNIDEAEALLKSLLTEN